MGTVCEHWTQHMTVIRSRIGASSSTCFEKNVYPNKAMCKLVDPDEMPAEFNLPFTDDLGASII